MYRGNQNSNRCCNVYSHLQPDIHRHSDWDDYAADRYPNTYLHLYPQTDTNACSHIWNSYVHTNTNGYANGDDYTTHRNPNVLSDEFHRCIPGRLFL